MRHSFARLLSCLLFLLLVFEPSFIVATAADGQDEAAAGSPVGKSIDLSASDSAQPDAANSSPPSSGTQVNQQPGKSSAVPEEKQSGTATAAASAKQGSVETSATAAQVHSAPLAAAKPKMLFGRIEELCTGPSATLPLKLKAMQPLRDVSLDGKVTNDALNGKASANLRSYPVDFRGTWSGELTIFSSTFAPIRWEFDRAEADREYKLMRPGTKGQCTVTFYQGNNNAIQLEPCEVVFTTTMDSKQLKNQMQQMFGGLFSGAGGGPSMISAQVPYMYALHLGNLTAGVGVTGNQLRSQLMKNQLRQLAPGVLEQVVVTRDSDSNPSSGKIRNSYSESVLRFTKIDSNRLYLQTASVNYRNDGKFEDKVILYGTLNRTSGVNASTGYPSLMPGSGFGGMGSMQQIQQMMKQMQDMAR